MKTVIALDTYERLKVTDKEYGSVIPKGTEFQVSDERLEVLLGNNGYRVAFVKLKNEKKVEVEKDEVATEEVVEEVAKPKKKKSKK